MSLHFCRLYGGYVTVFANKTEYNEAVRRMGTPNDPCMYRIGHNGYHLSLPPALPLNDSESCPLCTYGIRKILNTNRSDFSMQD